MRGGGHSQECLPPHNTVRTTTVPKAQKRNYTVKFKSKFIKTKLIEISGENSPIEIYHYGSWTISLVKEFGGEMYRRKTDWHITNDIGEAWC